MATKYTWMGPSGSNPLLGLVENGKEITPVVNDAELKSLLSQNLLQEIKTTTTKSKG